MQHSIIQLLDHCGSACWVSASKWQNKRKRLEDLRVLKLEGCLDSGLTVGISSLVSVVPQGQ